jgi:hypothetical protein
MEEIAYLFLLLDDSIKIFVTIWPKEKVQRDKQRSTKHTHKNKDQVTQTPLKNGGEREA